MKQRKVKKELVLATYWDYLKHFGREEGRKKWREHKKKSIQQQVQEGKKIIAIGAENLPPLPGKDMGLPVEDLEPIQKAIIGGTERLDIRKNESDALECGMAMIDLIKSSAWNRWLKPQIQKDAVDFVMKATMASGEARDEAMGAYKYARKILKRIDNWIADYTFILRKKEKENAIQAKR